MSDLMLFSTSPECSIAKLILELIKLISSNMGKRISEKRNQHQCCSSQILVPIVGTNKPEH